MSTTIGATAYAAVTAALAAERCVILDGGIATELAHAPADVLAVHRRYVDAGCDVITTNTWGMGLAGAVGGDAIRVARQAIVEGGREGRTAVAFSLNGDMDGPDGPQTARLLARAFAEEPPDLILVETLSLVRPSLFATVQALLDTGLPVWLSFRRCRHGLCGVYGQHWGGPEGDAFGRAAMRFEEMGVGALLVNCIPPDHVEGMVSFLRDFTDLPLGVYPNLGYRTNAGWQSAEGVGGEEYAAMALTWRAEGAQIVGGCCGVTPGHIAAAGRRLAATAPGRRRAEPDPAEEDGPRFRRARHAQPWTDPTGRPLFPLRFPDLTGEGAPFVPSPPTLMLWQHLFGHAIGAGQRCLDIGCATGLQTIQLARNGAAHVHGIDADPAAVADAMTNAFRNGVADRVTAAAVDLFPWRPEERYDVIVASLYQTPVDPFQSASTRRPVDYWGRNLVDHLIGQLPDALTADGCAYLTHLSTLSQERTADLLAQHDLQAEVVDFTCFPFTDDLRASQEHIERVEGLSDAYHLHLGTADVMVAYLLRITRG